MAVTDHEAFVGGLRIPQTLIVPHVRDCQSSAAKRKVLFAFGLTIRVSVKCIEPLTINYFRLAFPLPIHNFNTYNFTGHFEQGFVGSGNDKVMVSQGVKL